MKICFDTDGTKTDNVKFLYSTAVPYFKKHYDMEIVNPNMVEIEDVFDIKNVLINRGFSEEEAIKETKKIINKFWVSPIFLKYALLMPFRKGVSKCIKEFQKDGFEVEIDSSRDKTTKKNFIGCLTRFLTMCQYRLNRVFLPKKQIIFHESDEAKVSSLMEKSEKDDIILFDDKPSVIEQVSKFGNVVCVNCQYNEDFDFSTKVARIDSFENDEAKEAVKSLIGEKNYNYMVRINASEKFYHLLKTTVAPIILKKFDPIILGKENIYNDSCSVVYAPNHRSTLDPLIITSFLNVSIHWAALKRFFDGKDSIFNNSKNKILCDLTSYSFKKLEFFPIERQKDNANRNNIVAIKDMNGFLKAGASIGIFPEGTTNKEPDIKDFYSFDDSFLRLAKRNDAVVQPITGVWIKDLQINNKVIFKVGKPFKVCGSIDEAMALYVDEQKQNIEEIKVLIEDLKLKK